MKTYTAKPGEIEREWFLVDAEGQTLGRLATRIADTLRGKGKPQYTPHVDSGDFVVVVNAEKVAVTGSKLDTKIYYRHSGYPGGSGSGRCASSSSAVRPRSSGRPSRACSRRTARGRADRQAEDLAGPEHPHAAQAPKPLELP